MYMYLIFVLNKILKSAALHDMISLNLWEVRSANLQHKKNIPVNYLVYHKT